MVTLLISDLTILIYHHAAIMLALILMNGDQFYPTTKKMKMKNRIECTLRLNILSFCQFGMRTKGYRNVTSLDISYITFIVLYGEWNVNYFLCLARSPMVLRTCDLVVHSFTIPSNHDLLYYWKSQFFPKDAEPKGKEFKELKKVRFMNRHLSFYNLRRDLKTFEKSLP